jgi:Carboxyltransferase domain, subdomain A and B
MRRGCGHACCCRGRFFGDRRQIGDERVGCRRCAGGLKSDDPAGLLGQLDISGLRWPAPSLTPDAVLDMPSEPIAYGSIQVSGDGAPTVLLADHQTTGGYPKIATVVSDQISDLVQHRSRSQTSSRSVAPEAAVQEFRMRRQLVEAF